MLKRLTDLRMRQLSLRETLRKCVYSRPLDYCNVLPELIEKERFRCYYFCLSCTLENWKISFCKT